MPEGDAPEAGRRLDPARRGDLHLPDVRGGGQEALKGSGVKVASVATAFPSGQSFIDIKLAETRAAVAAGADEIDMVIDRGAFHSGDYQAVFEEIVAIKDACGEAHLKVILETGELGTFDNVRRASVLAMAAGADFIKTSTGKITPAATLPVTLVMLEAIRDFERVTGKQIGMKPAGGIKTAKEAIQYLVVLYETLGPRWMTPDWFRFGASSLLNDVLMQLEKERTGAYQRRTDSHRLDRGVQPLGGVARGCGELRIHARQARRPGHGRGEVVQHDRRLPDPLLDVERGVARGVGVHPRLHAALAQPAHVVPDLADRAARVVLAGQDQQRRPTASTYVIGFRSRNSSGHARRATRRTAPGRAPAGSAPRPRTRRRSRRPARRRSADANRSGWRPPPSSVT